MTQPTNQPINQSQPAPSPTNHQTIRILAYNLWFGGADKQDAIHDVLSHCNADFIGLTEADDPHVITTLAKRLNMHHVWAQGSGDRHIAALSRFPIRDWQVHNTPPLTQAVLEVTLDLDPPLTIYVVHLLPYLLIPFELRRWQAVGKLLSLIQEQNSARHLLIGDFNCIAPNHRVLHDKNPEKMRRLLRWQLNYIPRWALPRLI
jgi:endonuclease/exonuclease/phosphatase family metal-dependent hydrolase